ncbi:MAG: hypothetical protein P8I27_10465 [Pirellulaceae bacterium]|nr:hypothetical protein [Pirellulaceae bacterium]
MFASTKQIALLVMLAVTWVAPNTNHAQLSENEVVQHLSPKTFMVVNFNIEAITAGLGENNEVLQKYRARDAASSLDNPNAKQILMFLTDDKLDPAAPFNIPFATLIRYPDTIDQEFYLAAKNKRNSEWETFAPQSLDGQDLVVGQYSEHIGDMQIPNNAYFFPVEDMVVEGTLPMMKAMLVNQTEGNEGPEIASNVNFEAEFHCIFEDGSKLMSVPMLSTVFEQMLGTASLPIPSGGDPVEIIEAMRRLEVLFDSNETPTLKATIEFSTEKAAKQVEELIQVGMQAAPALIMMAEAAIREDANITKEDLQQMEPVIELAKAAIKELKIERNESTIQIELAAVDGLKKFPADLMTILMIQEMEIDRITAELEGAGEPELQFEAELQDDGVR